MRKSPRSGLAAGAGELIGMARRFNTNQTWPSGTNTNPSLDVIDWDPYGLYATSVCPFSGRFVVMNFIRCVFGGAGGAARYMRSNIAGFYTCHGRFAFNTVEQTLVTVGGFIRGGKGNTFVTEVFQDSGVAATIYEFEQAVFFAGDT